jgi:hypothetical protein
MARKNRQTQTTQRKPDHVKSWTGPKPPAKVRPTTPAAEPGNKPSQPEVKPDQKPEVKPESPKSEN